MSASKEHPQGSNLVDSRPGTARVLVVEDEQGPREFLASELELAGFVVSQAATGEEGLEMARRFEPDVIVLDLMLPELNGFGLARTVRSLERTRSVGILAVSALASEALRREAIAAGCDAFLAKPAPAAAVIQQVHILAAHRESVPPEDRG
jgi:DNA-binding response OmpR family regulator